MKKSFIGIVILILALLLCSCEINEKHTIKEEDQLDDNTEDVWIFTEEEIYSFELLHSDWTKEQMDELDLKKEVNEPNGETKYYDDFIEYTYFDWFDSITPDVIEVYGKYEGPRGIKIGDKFEDVLKKFPQRKDWEKSENGEFYGKIYETELWQPTGYVRVLDERRKHVTLDVRPGEPFLRIFFKDDIVTHYTFYMTIAY